MTDPREPPSELARPSEPPGTADPLGTAESPGTGEPPRTAEPPGTADSREVRIRRARPEDASRIGTILSAGSRTPSEDGPDDPTPYEEVINGSENGPGGVLVAEVAGQVVGVCQLLIFRHLQHRGGWCGELESVHVDSRYRSLGIGGRLVEAAVEAARAAGCYRVQLTSHHIRTDAHRFYERHGFEASHHGFKRMLS